MFVEVNDLSTLIVVPEGDALANPALWQPFVDRFQCAFVIDSSNMARWQAWVTTPNVYLVQRGTLRFVNPVASYIKKSLEHFGAQPADAVFVTFSESSVRLAANARIGTLLIGKSPQPPSVVLPDVLAKDLDSALDVLDRHKAGQAVGWFLEAATWRAGSRRTFEEGDIWTCEAAVGDDVTLNGRVRLLALGRYFASEDSRSEKHPLTKRILRAKSDQDVVLARSLGSILYWQNEQVGFDIITRVPPKPSKDKDLLGWTIREAARVVEESGLDGTGGFSEKCKPELLVCTREYGKQRDAGGREMRRLNVKGAFACRVNLHGQSVVLVDDVHTTGETIAECARMLLRAGASSVTAVVFGQDQKVVTTRATFLTCPNCGEAMRYRVNRTNGNGFWGCSDWPDCQGTRKFDPGIERWNSQHSRDHIDDIPDIDF